MDIRSIGQLDYPYSVISQPLICIFPLLFYFMISQMNVIASNGRHDVQQYNFTHEINKPIISTHFPYFYVLTFS